MVSSVWGLIAVYKSANVLTYLQIWALFKSLVNVSVVLAVLISVLCLYCRMQLLMSPVYQNHMEQSVAAMSYIQRYAILHIVKSRAFVSLLGRILI